MQVFGIFPYHLRVSNDAKESEAGQAGAGTAMGSGLHAQVLEHLGLAICGQELATGTIMKIEDVERQYGVSRSVIRQMPVPILSRLVAAAAAISDTNGS